jgi:hypothetical protein
MYAAMPAILKGAMERAYAAAGWDLRASENKYGAMFPVFADLLEQIEKVISESKYSEDNKGDYSGALMTRVRSLTTGLNSMIFQGGEIAGKELFDENAVVDLSRVGSAETKSLIMGLLVMKLHEYRASNVGAANRELRHVTVLEEAHNLLKRVSTEQVSESSNIMGKSVEMLANSIAEMRAYGEGFVIADQSPGLLDMSVIRNTNTKIILRLPDRGDRELVGRAASLNDEQITELARLERGGAAIYQNDWVEPVLVKIDKCAIEEREFSPRASGDNMDETQVKRGLLEMLIQGRVNERLDFDLDALALRLPRLNLPAADRISLVKLFAEYRERRDLSIWRAENFAALSKLVSDILGKNAEVENEVLEARDNRELSSRLTALVRETIPGVSADVSLALSHCLMKNFTAPPDSDCRERIYKAWIEAERSGAL